MYLRGRIGLSILTYNSRDCIGTCLERAVAAVDGPIVVVDNASEDDTVRLVRESFPAIEVIETGRNLGYSAGNNIGARRLAELGCEFITFVNPDVELMPETLPELRAALESSPRAACAGGVASPDSFRREYALRPALLLYSNVRYMPVIRGWLRGAIGREDARHHIDPGSVSRGDEVAVISGACSMYRTEAFFAAGGFDERSFLYCEEFMIGERLRTLGYKVVAAPAAKYGHGRGSSSAGVTRMTTWRHFCASERVFVRDYLGWRWKAALLAAARTLDGWVWELAAWRKR